MHPDPFRYGQLMTMALARQRFQWQHTGALLAELMNGPRRRVDHRAWRASDFDPFRDQRATQVEQVSPQKFVATLIDVFL